MMKKILLALFFVGCLAVSSSMYYYLYTQIKEINVQSERLDLVNAKIYNSNHSFSVLSVRNSHLL